MSEYPSIGPRYKNEILAWEYDQRQPAPLPGELEWYLRYARLSGGPVLELACGSGRLLIPIARAGFDIDGVDFSEAMLNRLKNKLRPLDEQTGQRVRLYCQDMMEFQTDRVYALILLGDNSLQYLETKERTASCFQRVSNHLKPEGYFLILNRRFNLSDFKDGKVFVFDWEGKPVSDEETGVSVTSKLFSWFEEENSRIVDERIYTIKYNDGNTETIRIRAHKPLINTPDYVELLEETGFNVQVLSGYDERPDDGTSREICFVCKKLKVG